ncbi:MAG TPA: hypothetical protein VN363_03535 [Anaerolineales bacterium]|nr:hypothetical protein [Anaerolineales bacterium]
MTSKKVVTFLLLTLFLAACSAPQPAATEPPSASEAVAQETAPAATPPDAAAEFNGLPLVTDRGELFSGSGVCVACHTGMVDEAGVDVSIDRSWSATMLANASKDPYYLATVRSEVTMAPDMQAVIEDKCSSCHMPMAFLTATFKDEPAAMLDAGFKSAEHPLHGLAQDSISCNLCHQLEPDNFGAEASFSGGFAVDTELASGERKSYGPYVVDDQQASVMQAASGFVPVQGLHTAQSELCASCHNLVTPYLDAAGQVAGEFPEQAIYSEWQNSVYKAESTCIDCHMPVAKGNVQISLVGGPPRSPFSRHVFAGGNAFMLSMLRENGEEIGITARPADLDQSIQAASDIIGKQSATLAVENLKLDGTALTGEVVITSQTGHKFPAGYPSRRAWLHITVKDASGATVFESGAVNEDGLITGNDNDADPAVYEPHYTALTTPDQVQIYETILINSDGEVTTKLLRSAAYAKDNRLLPVGFDLKKATQDTLVFGDAAEDPDFAAGGDKLSLQIDLGSAAGPFTIHAELLYQSIGYRWAQNLMLEENPEAADFSGYYATVPNLPLVAAQAEATVAP